MRKKYLPVIVICLSTFLQNAHADSIAISGVSWHAASHGNGDSAANEINLGLGYEYSLNQNNTLAIGFYNNSFNRDTDYLLDFWQPLQWDTDIGKIKFGLAVGVATGYGDYWLSPMAVPLLTYENDNWGLNIVTLAAPIEQLEKKSVLAMQFKIKLP